MSTTYRAIWSDTTEPDRRGAVYLARYYVLRWALDTQDPPELPDGQFVAGERRTITLSTLDDDDYYGFQFVSVDTPATDGPSQENTWTTQVRVAATEEAVHTWIENGVETEDLTERVIVGRPRVVDDLLALPGNPVLGTAVLTGVQHINGNEVHVLIDLLRDPSRQLPFILRKWAEQLAKRTAGVAMVFVLDRQAVQMFYQELGELAVWGGAIRTYVPAPLDSLQDSWRHRYITYRQLSELEGRVINRIVYAVTQLSTRRPIPAVFRVFDRSESAISPADLARIEEGWREKLDAEYAERNQVEQELARSIGYADRLEAERDKLKARLNWLERKCVERDGESLFGSEPEDESDVELPPESVSCASDAVIAAQLYLSDYLEIPESAARAIDDIDTAAKAAAWGNTTWRGLRALAAYAEARGDGFEGGFWIWCERGDRSGWSASTKTLAMKESSTVIGNDRLLNRRRFPVSAEVDPSGSKVMQAHLKISEGGGRLAPRVYFHDDTGGNTGKVHVGYVGPHYLVPNTKS